MARIPRPPRPPRDTPSGGSSRNSGRDNAGDVDRSRSKVWEFVDAADSVVGLINGLLEFASHIPFIGELIDKINSLLQKMFDKVNEAIEKVSEIFAFVGQPMTLRQAGQGWVESVGKPSKAATATIVTAALPSTGHWLGKAHDGYIARVELQQPASDDIYAKCEMVDGELNTFADAIVDFWVAFSLSALGTAVGVALGVAEIASVWGTPAGIGTIIVEVISFVSDVVNLVNIIMTANEAAASFVSTVTGELASASAFPGGAWPRHAA